MQRLILTRVCTLASAMLVVLGGCRGGDAGLGAGSREIRGEFAVGDAVVRFNATFQDTTLISVAEEQVFGELGAARARYDVVNGRLVYYRCDERRRVMNREAGDDYESVCLEFEFELDGRLRSECKPVDGRPADLLGYEAPGVQRHFAELKRRADLAQGAAVGGL